MTFTIVFRLEGKKTFTVPGLENIKGSDYHARKIMHKESQLEVMGVPKRFLTYKIVEEKKK